MPGPNFPVYVAGAKILAMVPFGPPSGAATNITLFSYDGEAHVGITSDVLFHLSTVEDATGTPRTFHDVLDAWLRGDEILVVDAIEPPTSQCEAPGEGDG